MEYLDFSVLPHPVGEAESIEANPVHGSDSAENAAIEIAYFFAQTEIHSR